MEHTTRRGGRTGTPSVGLSPGSLAHPSRAPSSRPPSYLVLLACGTGITYPCKGCSAVTPRGGMEPGRQRPSVRGAGPLDAVSRTPLRPSPAWFPMLRVRPDPAGLGGRAWTTPRLSGGGLVPHGWPSSLRGEQGGRGSRSPLLQPETFARRRLLFLDRGRGVGHWSWSQKLRIRLSEHGKSPGSDPEAHSIAGARAAPVEPTQSRCAQVGAHRPPPQLCHSTCAEALRGPGRG